MSEAMMNKDEMTTKHTKDTKRWKRYEKYKDSGVAWLGEVPEHWNTSRIKLEILKNDLEIQDGNHGELHPTSDDYVQSGIPFVMANHIENGRVNFEKCNYIEKELADRLRIGFAKTGDVLLTHKGTVGRIGIIEEIKSPYVMLTPQVTYYRYKRNVFNKFLFYFMQGKLWQEQLSLLGSVGSTRAYIGLIEQRNLIIAYPIKQNEQESISKFLDTEITKIDLLLENKQRLLELLKEKRMALVSRAVTKGLDPNVKMKASGVEWLGDVPEHWEIKRIKQFSKIRYGIGEPPEYIQEGTPLIRATNVNHGKIETKNLVQVNPDDIPSGRILRLQEGDIIVVRSGAYTGDSSIIPKEFDGAIAGFDMVVKTSKCNSRYLAYSLLSKYIKEGQIDLEKTRAAQPHLNAEELGNCIILLPTQSEQIDIVKHIDCEILKIDLLSSKVETAIEKLKEYRMALISAAVTGKIDVRESA